MSCYRDGSGWRKKVEWDDQKKVYMYRGVEIIPLSWEERSRMPIYLQHEYYWEEIEWIDHVIEGRGQSPSKDSEPVWITLERMSDYFDGDESAYDRPQSYYEDRMQKWI